MNDGRMMLERMNARTMCGGTRYGRILLIDTITQQTDHFYGFTTITLSTTNHSQHDHMLATERTCGHEPATVGIWNNSLSKSPTSRSSWRSPGERTPSVSLFPKSVRSDEVDIPSRAISWKSYSASLLDLDLVRPTSNLQPVPFD